VLVVRPGTIDDLDTLMDLFSHAGERLKGMSSLKPDRDFLTARLLASEAAFNDPTEPSDGARDFFFILCDAYDPSVAIGTSAIYAAVGLESAFYSFRVGTTVHASRELDVYNRLRTLHVSNDYTGATEVGSLFLDPAFVGSGAGRLVSLARMLVLGQHGQLFSEKLIAEMRGYQDDEGNSPLWEGLGRAFFTLPFPEADRLSGLGNKVFISELMPHHPIYVHLLSQEAQDAIGRVHPSTIPARRLLESEGFAAGDYIDIFDGGPTLEARLSDLRAVREGRVVEVITASDLPQGPELLIGTRHLPTFRATVSDRYLLTDSTLAVSNDTLDTLGAGQGDPLNVTPFRKGLAVI
jgi:arginine N-succinyltransferase